MEVKIVIYYIIPGHIFTLFLSMSHLTAVGFSEKVRDYVGGHLSDFKVYELNKGKTLVYEPKSKGFKRNVIVFLRKDKFHYNLVYNESFSNKDVEIRKGSRCNNFTLIKENGKWQLFDCPKSLFFIKKTKSSISVNGKPVLNQIWLSKGPPVYVNGKLIYYQGRTL